MKRIEHTMPLHRSQRILCTLVLCFCFGLSPFDSMLIARNSDSVSPKRDTVVSVDSMTRKNLRGRYYAWTPHGTIRMKVGRKKYHRRGFTMFGWCIDKGRYEIRGDTLVLMQSWYREHPFARKERDSIPYELKFVMKDENLCFFRYADSARDTLLLHTEYTSRREYFQTRRLRRELRNRT